MRSDEAGDAAPAKAAPAEVLPPEELLRRAEEEANIDEVSPCSCTAVLECFDNPTLQRASSEVQTRVSQV